MPQVEPVGGQRQLGEHAVFGVGLLDLWDTLRRLLRRAAALHREIEVAQREVLHAQTRHARDRACDEARRRTARDVLDHAVLQFRPRAGGVDVPPSEPHEDRGLHAALHDDVVDADVLHHAAVHHFKRNAGKPRDGIRDTGQPMLPLAQIGPAGRHERAVLDAAVAEAAPARRAELDEVAVGGEAAVAHLDVLGDEVRVVALRADRVVVRIDRTILDQDVL